MITGGYNLASKRWVNASDSTSSLQNSWAGGTAGYDTFFWGVSGSGGWSKMDLSESDKNVKATISVKSSTTVEVTPGDWYDGGSYERPSKRWWAGLCNSRSL